MCTRQARCPLFKGRGSFLAGTIALQPVKGGCHPRQLFIERKT
jgi:hypothetical protein